MSRKQEVRDDEKDLGFGTRLTDPHTRLLNFPEPITASTATTGKYR